MTIKETFPYHECRNCKQCILKVLKDNNQITVGCRKECRKEEKE